MDQLTLRGRGDLLPGARGGRRPTYPPGSNMTMTRKPGGQHRDHRFSEGSLNKALQHSSLHRGAETPYPYQPHFSPGRKYGAPQSFHDRPPPRHLPGDVHHGMHSEVDHSCSGPFQELTNASKSLPVFREDGDTVSLNSDLAVVKVVDWLSSDEGRRQSFRSLELARKIAGNGRSERNMMPFKIWSTLDNGLFKGRLSPGVYLNWAQDATDLDYESLGQTFAPGKLEVHTSRVERVAILLNPHFLVARSAEASRAHAHQPEQFGTPEDNSGNYLISMLVHQMIHAWFMRACGPQKQASTADHRLKHGQGFWKIMHAIIDIARQLDSKLDGHSIDRGQSLAEALIRIHKPLDQQGSWRLPRSVQVEMDKEQFEHTICHLKIIQLMSKEDADAWYKKTSAAAKDAVSPSLYSLDQGTGEPKPIPRHERGSPFSYIEIIWDRMAFDYKRKSIEKEFESLREVLSKGKRVFVLPRGVDVHTFKALDSFLKTGRDYLPEMKPVPSAGPLILMPPFRKKGAVDELWIDVRAFKLGTALGFTEFVRHAQDRLRAARTLRTSPIEAFQEVYSSHGMTAPFPFVSGKTTLASTAVDTTLPDDVLREWARRLMLTTRAANSSSGYYSSNLFTIDKHCGSGGIQGLVAATQSAELEQDYQICLTQLWRQTPKSMHPAGGILSGGGRPLLDQIPLDETDLTGRLARRDVEEIARQVYKLAPDRHFRTRASSGDRCCSHKHRHSSHSKPRSHFDDSHSRNDLLRSFLRDQEDVERHARSETELAQDMRALRNAYGL